MADEATREGKHFIAAWLRQKERHERCVAEIKSAAADLDEAAQALAKWMLPEDAKPGEKIALWHSDSLFQVEVGNDSPPSPHKVTIRTRGKHFYELRDAS